jgi:HEAT repeat protein
MNKLLTISVLASVMVGCGGPQKAPLPPLADEAGKNPRSQVKIPKAKEAPKPPPRQEIALDKTLAATARRQVTDALRSGDALVRGQAIEALRYNPDAEARQQIIAAFDDRNVGICFAAVMMAGELQIKEAQPALLKLAEDPNPNVGVAVRFALHKLGDKRRTNDLLKYAVNPDPKVRANAATVLGLLGESSGLKILRTLRLDPDPFVRMQAYEAMWRLGDETALRSLATLTASQYASDRMTAILAMAAPQRQVVREQVRGFLAGDDVQTEVTLVAARAMGMLGSDEGYKIAQDAAGSKDPYQRFLAALAFGAIGRSDAQDELRKLMSDAEPNVQLAAATAILQLNKGSSVAVSDRL